MGRRFQRNRFAQRKRDRKQNEASEVQKEDRRNEPYVEIVRNNEAFIAYYKRMNICPEAEFEQFLEVIRADLPTTFRITGSRSTAQKLMNIIKSEFFNSCVVPTEGGASEIKRPLSLPWYPNEMGWQLELSRRDIRRSESLYKLHNFLISETNVGSISRQEAVSMIPPLVLDVQPHHKVLDMCAAPGSKTAQLIEALHADETQPIPTGFVVANDVDNKRCYMLVHQAKRMNSPCFMVTNHDSSVMPQFFNKDNTRLKFDRILADVPCSGDGTLRKNPDIWMKWNQQHALNLHGIQFRVARRGAELLAVGGRLVYSTCSLNPVENEAVLHRLVKESEGALEIVDASAMVPGLKYAPGITQWELSNKGQDFYKSFDEVPEQYHTIIRPQMFPPSPTDAPQYNLERCMRILPHFQNTGAFFVAVLVKKKLMPWERNDKNDAAPPPATVATDENGVPIEGGEANGRVLPPAPPRKKRRMHGYKEDPFVFFVENEPIWKSIQDFYEIEKCTKNFDPACLLTRCIGGKKKNLYFCSQQVKDVVVANEFQIKIINTGVKTWVRCDNRNMRCEFRLANEGLTSVEFLIGPGRRIDVGKEDLIALLQNNDPANPPELVTLSEGVQQRAANVTNGSCLLVYTDETQYKYAMVGWRGTKSLRAYTDTNDSIHFLRLLGADVSKYELNKFKTDGSATPATEGQDENATPTEDDNVHENEIEDVEIAEEA